MRADSHKKEHDEGPLSRRALFSLSLFSSYYFIFAALITQFLLTLITSFWLRLYHITFEYSLFAITFLSESSNSWTAGQIYLVFGAGPVSLTLLGLVCLFVLRRDVYAGWKIKLALTWLTFFMLNVLPGSILAGAIFYEGFGMAFQWLIGNFILRGLIALGVLVIMILFSRFWWKLFLRTAYTTALIDHSDHQRTFIRSVYFWPWIVGFIVLMLFNWPFENPVWRTYLLSLGFLSLAVFDRRPRMHRKPNIMKSDKKIFATKWQPLWFFLILLTVWLIDLMVTGF